MRANMSPRTFFNYFSTKEDAIVGFDESILAEAAARLLRRPLDESPLEAVHRALVEEEGEPTPVGIVEKIELVHRFPELLSRHLAVSHELEEKVSYALTTRLDLMRSDPYPRLVVSVAFAALRSTVLWWLGDGQPGRLPEHLAVSFAALEDGLPHVRQRVQVLDHST